MRSGTRQDEMGTVGEEGSGVGKGRGLLLSVYVSSEKGGKKVSVDFCSPTILSLF